MDLVFRAVAAYALVLLFTRVLGKRELSSLQPFDLIILVVIGDLIQQGVTQNDLSITGVAIVLGTIGVVQVLVSYASFRLPPIRPILEGEPVVLVDHGKVLDRNMRRERLTLDDLTEQARQNGISSFDEVTWAVLETNGQVSFIKSQG
ncbi:MAG: hypothetical protein QOE64_1956 [Frankiales bacterium]|nr:hypothetical protein [Frankiales bacterium]